jgi:hypothetical protein
MKRRKSLVGGFIAPPIPPNGGIMAEAWGNGGFLYNYTGDYAENQEVNFGNYVGKSGERCRKTA